MHAQRGLSYVCVHCWHWLAHPLRLPYAHDMYIQGQLVMLTETVASMAASMVAKPMM